MPQIFIPKINSKIKLTQDWFARVSYCYDNARMLRLIDPSYAYGQPSAKVEYCFEAGTVFMMGKCESVYTYDRSDNYLLRLTVMDSPNKSILPKKDGGTHMGRLSFYVALDLINGVDIEMVED